MPEPLKFTLNPALVEAATEFNKALADAIPVLIGQFYREFARVIDAAKREREARQ